MRNERTIRKVNKDSLIKFSREAYARLKKFVVTNSGKALIIALVWQIMMTGFGFLVDTSMEMFKNNAQHGASIGLLGHTGDWDGGWYYTVANHFYDLKSSPASPAFYPLFPLSVVFVRALFFNHIGFLGAGIIVNTICLWLGLWALLGILKYFTGKKELRWLGLTIFITSPAAVFMHLFYGEAIFVAAGFWAYLFALKRNWALSAVLLALATAARLPALAFIALCGLEYLRSYNWSIKSALNKKILWFLITPVGFLLYGIYLQIVRGDFLAMFHAYHATNDWTYYSFNPNIFHTIGKSAKAVLTAIGPGGQFDSNVMINNLLPVLGIGVLFLASIYALFVMKGKGIPLGVFGLISMVMFTINGHTVSVHRYLLPCIVIFIVAVDLMNRFKKLKLFAYPVIYGGLLLQAYILILFINGYFAG